MYEKVLDVVLRKEVRNKSKVKIQNSKKEILFLNFEFLLLTFIHPIINFTLLDYHDQQNNRPI